MSNPRMSGQDHKNVETTIRCLSIAHLLTESDKGVIRSLASLMFSAGRISAMSDNAERTTNVFTRSSTR